MSRSVDQKTNWQGFVKPGELVDIRAGVELTLQDRRIFNLLIENAWSEITEDKEHEIAVALLRGPRHKGGERVGQSVTALMTTLVEVPTAIDGEAAVFKTQLLGDTCQVIDEDSPKAVLRYRFPNGLRKIIQDSRYWGRIKAHVMFAFTSKYALRLYEAVCLRANLRTDEQTMSVEDFRALLGIEKGKLTEPFNLKKWAIEPALAEVNGLSDFHVRVEAIRQGGLVRGPLTGFLLSWNRKSSDEWRAVLDELMRPKVGRRARITGKVEKIS